MQINYETIVTTAREAARDILRSRKVSALLGYIRTQKAKLTSLTKQREEIVTHFKKMREQSEKEVARATYAAQHAVETGNPDAETLQQIATEAEERHDAALESLKLSETRQLEDFDREAAVTTDAVEAKIAEYKEKIAAWESGESKVSYDEMVTLAEKMVAERIKETFIDGGYDPEETS